MSDELKPCPFCGEQAVLLADYRMLDWWVECDSCGCQTDKDDKRGAAEAWNRRLLARLPEELATRLRSCFWRDADGMHLLATSTHASVLRDILAWHERQQQEGGK